MKGFIKRLALVMLALTLVLAQVAHAEPNNILKGVFDALMAENSVYSQSKALYLEYYPDLVCEETLADDSFTIAFDGEDDLKGSWTFTLEGDYITGTFAEDDYLGASYAMVVLYAIGDYYGMNSELLGGYVNGLATLGLENKYLIMDDDEAAGTTTIKLYAAGAYDMAELDQMVLDAASLEGFGPLDENYSGSFGRIGKILMVANGNVSDLRLLIGEFGGLDDLAYQSIINTISILQPEGWEDFVANYTELADAQGENYIVTVHPSLEEVSEYVNDPTENEGYAILLFGSAMMGDDDDTVEYIFDDTVWQSGDMMLEFAWQDGYYTAVLTEGETELRYLCDYFDYIDGDDDAVLPALMGISADDGVTFEEADYWEATFVFDWRTDEMIWEQEDGTRVVFTQAM